MQPTTTAVPDEEEYIDLGHLLLVLWGKAWIIVLAMAFCGALAFFGTRYLITPLFQSKALMYVNNSTLSVGNTAISLSDLSASKSLVDTYTVILKTRLTLNEVIRQAGLPYTYEELSKMVDAKAVNNTEVFEIVVTGPNPEETTLIANTIVDVLPDKISEIVDGSSVRTVDLAVVPAKKYSPSFTKNTAIGLLIGMVISSGLIILLDLLDDIIHSEEQLTSVYGLPTLVVIPDLYSKQTGKHYESNYMKAKEAVVNETPKA